MKTFFVALIASLAMLRLDLSVAAPTTEESLHPSCPSRDIGPNLTGSLCSDNFLDIQHYITETGCKGVGFKCIISCTQTENSEELTLAYICPNGKIVTHDRENLATMVIQTNLSKKKKCRRPPPATGITLSASTEP